MKEDSIAVLVKPKKYIEMLEQVNYGAEVKTMYNLPVIISKDIEEDMKFVNKKELEEIQTLEQRRYTEFIKEYISDLEFMNGK